MATRSRNVRTRLTELRPRAAIALVAAILALATVAVLLGPRLLTCARSSPAAQRPPAVGCPLPLPSPEVGGIFALIPPGDFEAAGPEHGCWPGLVENSNTVRAGRVSADKGELAAPRRVQ